MKKNLMIAASAIALTLSLSAQEVNLAPGESVSVKLQRGGDLTVVGTDRNVVAITGASQGEFEISRSGKGVSVRDAREGNKRSLRLEVPRRTDLHVHTSGGSITIENVEGKISGRTMGGQLRLSKLGGTLDLSTMGGDIRLTDSTVDGKVSTMGGQVRVKDVVGDVKASSMGGNVIYENVTSRSGKSTGRTVVITTMGGEIKVQEAPAGAEVTTMGGDIEIRTANDFVKAKTMGGDIRLPSVAGWVKGSTMGGDIDVRIVPASGKQDVDLTSMGGNIVLVLPAGFDGSFDIELDYTQNSKRKFQIESDFPLQLTESPDWEYGKGSPKKTIRASGRTGSGKNVVKLRTTNGNIEIRRGK